MAGEEMEAIYCREIRVEELRIFLASSEKGIRGLGISLDKGIDCLEYIQEKFHRNVVLEERQENRALSDSIVKLMNGVSLPRDFKLDIKGTPFQKKIWKTISTIPFGQIRTYGEVAQMAGKPGAARAVGQAMGANPVPIIFPCHRVVSAKGLGGFSSGLEVKKYLLQREKDVISSV